MNKKMSVKDLVVAALIAALYAVLTYVSAAFGLAYGAVQFRISEALCILPLFTPTAIYGLTVGCLISNIGSTLGVMDMLFGTAASLLASLFTYLLRNKSKVVSLLPPVIINALFVGAQVAIFTDDAGFFATFLYVALGQAVVVYGLGLPFSHIIKKTKIF